MTDPLHNGRPSLHNAHRWIAHTTSSPRRPTPTRYARPPTTFRRAPRPSEPPRLDMPGPRAEPAPDTRTAQLRKRVPCPARARCVRAAGLRTSRRLGGVRLHSVNFAPGPPQDERLFPEAQVPGARRRRRPRRRVHRQRVVLQCAQRRPHIQLRGEAAPRNTYAMGRKKGKKGGGGRRGGGDETLFLSAPSSRHLIATALVPPCAAR